jgi:hypothetical protein
LIGEDGGGRRVWTSGGVGRVLLGLEMGRLDVVGGEGIDREWRRRGFE